MSGPQHKIWNGKDNHGRGVASGIYIYELNAGELTATKKMILLPINSCNATINYCVVTPFAVEVG